LSRAETLKELERVLESFLERAVSLKEDRLHILGGINRLDDIAQGLRTGEGLAEEVGNWFAEHNDWLRGDRLRQADHNRIGLILARIEQEMGSTESQSAAFGKIKSEIGRWTEAVQAGKRKLELRRGPESAASREPGGDTVGDFSKVLSKLQALFADLSGSKAHILSVLDESLAKADLQKDKDALLLSGLIIYYLKQEKYKVEPYVKRLKDAELRLRG
jgi:hypothetical protein